MSDEAFAALRREKRPNESESGMILRLQRTADKRAKDPLAFFDDPPKADLTPDEYDEMAAG